MILAPARPSDPSSELAWSLTVEGFDPISEAVVESIFAVSNGYVGVQASLAEGGPASNPATFVAGVFTSASQPGAVPELVTGPDWLRLRITVEGHPLQLERGEILQHRRWLDFRRGLAHRDWVQRDPSGRITRLRLSHCASIADRHLLLQRVELTPENYTGELVVEALMERCASKSKDLEYELTMTSDGPILLLDRSGANATVTFALTSSLNPPVDHAVRLPITGDDWAGQRWTWQAHLGRTYRLDKLVAVHTSRDGIAPAEAAASELATRSAAKTWGGLLDEHERAWTKHWSISDVVLAEDPGAQRALRFAVHHLIGAANPDDERVSIGARALTGEAYMGHVFWDTEIFLLPFYLATEPAAARALLMYRYHTLPAARAKAAHLGFRGALYAWESANTGDETTPEEVIGLTGEAIPIWTGRRAHHISADVAYAVWQYWRATRDLELLRTAGAEILLETARFWTSRATVEADGRYHIRQVIGPDEYHESIDDNAYTNAMARWNLRRAVDVVAVLRQHSPEDLRTLTDRLHIDDVELTHWLEVADGLVDGADPSSGLIEQFEGYHRLDEVDLAAYEPRNVPMDVLLGRQRTERSQVIKQADVLMLLYLLPEDYPASVLETNFDYYEPRTGHGSSLSPGIHAALAARLGRMSLAERYFAETAAIDLNNGMGNAAGGVHIAALGSLWQIAVRGFAGVQWLDDALVFEPRIPASWGEMRFRLNWRGRQLQFLLTAKDDPRGEVRIETGPPLRLVTPGDVPRILRPGEALPVGPSRRYELQEERTSERTSDDRDETRS